MNDLQAGVIGSCTSYKTRRNVTSLIQDDDFKTLLDYESVVSRCVDIVFFAGAAVLITVLFIAAQSWLCGWHGCSLVVVMFTASLLSFCCSFANRLVLVASQQCRSVALGGDDNAQFVSDLRINTPKAYGFLERVGRYGCGFQV